MADFRVEGLDDFRRALRKFPEAAQRGALRGMTHAAILVQRGARERAPVDTGRLRASIAYRAEALAAGARAIIGSRVEYAPYQEFGTQRGIRPKRYLRGSIEANKDEIIRVLVQHIQREISKL